MEMTLDEYRQIKKDLRRRFSKTGWILLLYYGIMNAAVAVVLLFEMLIRMIPAALHMDEKMLEDAVMDAMFSGWGYFAAISVGFVVLLLWKKPRYLKGVIFEKKRPMTFGSFLGLLCVFLGGQLVFQIVSILVEMLLNCFGLTFLEGMAEMSLDMDAFSMFLYGSVLAPVSEEILFRGLVQKELMPFGRRFAVFCSAFTFGIFHGNLLQSGFAFLVGLVLGYVASEYSIVWAMLLHMINNLVLADMLPRLTSFMPEAAANLIFWLVLILAGLCGIVALIVDRKSLMISKL